MNAITPPPVVRSPKYGVMVKLDDGRLMILSKAGADLMVANGFATRSKNSQRPDDWDTLGKGRKDD